MEIEKDKPTDLVLEEYKILVDERRFIMTRYMQAFAVYLTIIGLSLKGILEATEQDERYFLFALVTMFNIVGFFAARYFAKMAMYCMERESYNAKILGYLGPGNHAWGYWIMLSIFIVIEAIVGCVVFL